MDEEEATLRAKLDEETSYEERRKIRAALRELRKKKVQELAKPLSETHSSSALLGSTQNDSTGITSSVSESTSRDTSSYTNGNDRNRHDEEASVINGLNLDEIKDEDEIQRLIESTPLTAYNDRKKLRARLRQLKKERSEDQTSDSVPQDEVKQDLVVESVENDAEVSQNVQEAENGLSEAELKAKIAAQKAEEARATKARAKAALQAKKEAEEKARQEEEERRREAEERRREAEERRREAEERAKIEKEKEERAKQEAEEERQREKERIQNAEQEEQRGDKERRKSEGEVNENEDESNNDENGVYYNEWDYDEYSRHYEEEFPDSESVSSRSSESSSWSAQGLLKPRHPTSAFKREKIKTVSEHEKEAKEALKKLRKTNHSERLMGFKGAPAIKTDVKETYDFKGILKKQDDSVLEPGGILKKKRQQEEKEDDINFKQHLRKTGEDLTRKKAGVKKDPKINTLDLRDTLKKTEVAGELYKSPIRRGPKVEKEKPQKFPLRQTGETLPGQKITMEKYLKSKEKAAGSGSASPKPQLKETGIHLPGRKAAAEEGQEVKKPFKKITSAELMACIAQTDADLQQRADFMKQRAAEKPASEHGPIKKLLPQLSFEEQQQDYKRVVESGGGSMAGRLDVRELVNIKARQKEKLKETEVKPEFRNVLKKSDGPKKSRDEQIPEEALEWINKPKPLQKRVTEQNVDEVYKRNINKPKAKTDSMQEKEDYHMSRARAAEVRKLEERREAKRKLIVAEGKQADFSREMVAPKSSYIPNYNIIKTFQTSAELAAFAADQKENSIANEPKKDLHMFRNELVKAAQAKEARGSSGEAAAPTETKVVWSEPTPAPAAKEETVN